MLMLYMNLNYRFIIWLQSNRFWQFICIDNFILYRIWIADTVSFCFIRYPTDIMRIPDSATIVVIIDINNLDRLRTRFVSDLQVFRLGFTKLPLPCRYRFS